MTNLASAQQTFRPPVHLQPNGQHHAAIKYGGIGHGSNTPYQAQTQPPSRAIPRGADSGAVNTSPRFQARVSRAFSKTAESISRGAKNVSENLKRPIRDVVNSQKNSAPIPAPSLLRRQPTYASQQTIGTGARQPVIAYTSPTPVESVVPRRRPMPRYQVQNIKTGTVSEPQLVDVAPPEDDARYYERPDIQRTSSQQIFDEPEDFEEVAELILDDVAEDDVTEEVVTEEVVVVEPKQEFLTQTPLRDEPLREEPIAQSQLQARPVSILQNQENELRLREDDELENDLEDELEGIDGEETDDIDDLPEPQQQTFEQSCDEQRFELLNNPITAIALDISPPKSAIANQTGSQYRTWNDQFGRQIASGSIRQIRRGYLVLDNGAKVPVGNLSDAELRAMSSDWIVPNECSVSSDSFAGRSWINQTVTWKASNLCHKPLFFENVQLERYGHSHGPFTQPLWSTAHFFGSLAFAPYNAGINPPNECQYALGYYRPGNCAPWLREPLPISLAGLRYQAAAATGTAFLFIP